MVDQEAARQGVSMPRRIFGGIMGALGILLVVFPHEAARVTRYDALTTYSANLVDETLERDQATFLVLSGIKTSLAMIEGSSVGVGFELEVGDVVQPAYDYVDFFWRVFLYAFMVMGAYKILLETGMLELGIVLTGIGFAVAAVGLVMWPAQPRLRMWGRRCALMGLMMAYVVPIALIATDGLNRRYTEPIRERHVETMVALETRLGASALRFSLLRNRVSILSPGQSFEEIRTTMMEVVDEAGEAVRSSLQAFLYFALVLLFDLVFFPLFSAFIMYKFAQFAIGRLTLPEPSDVSAPAPAAVDR